MAVELSSKIKFNNAVLSVLGFYLTSAQTFQKSVLREVLWGCTAQYNLFYEKLGDRRKISFTDCFVHPGNEARDFSVQCVASNVATSVDTCTGCRDDSFKYPFVIVLHKKSTTCERCNF